MKGKLPGDTRSEIKRVEEGEEKTSENEGVAQCAGAGPRDPRKRC